MTQGATIYRFDINLSDLDRERFEEFRLQTALHPSEALPYFIARILAYCLEYRDDLQFAAGGVSGGDPTLSAQAPDGHYELWVEIGVPTPERLRKARRAERSAIYSHKDTRQLPAKLSVAAADQAGVPLYLLDPSLVEALTQALTRNNSLTVTRSGDELYVQLNGESVQGTIQERRLQEG